MLIHYKTKHFIKLVIETVQIVKCENHPTFYYKRISFNLSIIRLNVSQKEI